MGNSKYIGWQGTIDAPDGGLGPFQEATLRTVAHATYVATKIDPLGYLGRILGSVDDEPGRRPYTVGMIHTSSISGGDELVAHLARYLYDGAIYFDDTDWPARWVARRENGGPWTKEGE